MTDHELRHWRMVAFVVRCAQRYSPMYCADRREPACARAAVSDAVSLAESLALSGECIVENDDRLMVGDAHFDQYDLDALRASLAAYDNAAQNTYADLHSDPDAGRSVRRLWTAIRLARLALYVAYETGGSESVQDHVDEAVSWSSDHEPWLERFVGADLVRAMTSTVSPEQGLDALFGELWPDGTSDRWTI